ncbi:uncharacterized protein LOC126700123 isoform X2 [Quercus robur]|uniref:uncharacterized protein LOC126700123 isoform X2 n=1 Tax=Quercus robur TaxID=38942 RepID=UPI00216333C0|nr:uncharacterized protein LOC126700123 isoform X2 [Quercus robur]
MLDGRDVRTTQSTGFGAYYNDHYSVFECLGLMLMMMESGTGFGAISVSLKGNLRLNSVKRVPLGAMPESFGGEYCCLFGDRLWDDHIAVLLIHELGHLTRKPQKSICIILAPTVALVQQAIWLVHCTIMK